MDEDAQKLHPLAEAQAVAGLASGPTSGEAAVVIGNRGRTIVNGFYVEAAGADHLTVKATRDSHDREDDQDPE